MLFEFLVIQNFAYVFNNYFNFKFGLTQHRLKTEKLRVTKWYVTTI